MPLPVSTMEPPDIPRVLPCVPYDALQQHTLNAPVTWEGVGLHTGAHVRVRVEPLPADKGLWLERADVASDAILIRPGRILETRRATVLGGTARGRLWTVSTVEHLLAALYGCGVDNALIRVHGPEIPILDGSALPFVLELDAVGYQPQAAPRRWLPLHPDMGMAPADSALHGPVSAPAAASSISPTQWIRCLSAPVGHADQPGTSDGARSRRFKEDTRTSSDLVLRCHLDFPHPLLRQLTAEVAIKDFRTQLAGARTFGFENEVEALRQRGLIQGGSLDCALVMGATGWLNPEKVRFSDEPARHKLLDMLGDLAILGQRLKGTFEASAPGHALMAGWTRAQGASR